MSSTPKLFPLAYNCNLGASSTREVLDLNQAIQSMVEAFNRLTQTIRQKDEQALAAMSSKLKVSLKPLRSPMKSSNRSASCASHHRACTTPSTAR